MFTKKPEIHSRNQKTVTTVGGVGGGGGGGTASGTGGGVSGKIGRKVAQNSPNFNKTFVNKTNPNNSLKANNNNNNHQKQAIDTESKASLQQKLKDLEERLEKYDRDRQLITAELDRVCELKDNEIRDLRQTVDDKQREIDDQFCALRKSGQQFESELERHRCQLVNIAGDYRTKESLILQRNHEETAHGSERLH
ncbi:keratin, type I cytoskeletal 15-like [Oppia nitens]|uniref:keratin, type I cytoskeletal 15-like n=1 Tax=Oppia nitens TaxID=1686743 RepID=UPI0023DBAF86|nr:keratin, type I cytoskeletal 15-like [Oppia nitens]